jgi:HSF-type DNA-binding
VQWVLQQIAEDAQIYGKLRDTKVKDLFPFNLHDMVESSSMSSQSNIIRWFPHGRAFRVFDKDRLVNELLPRYLKRQTQFASFQRQLNMYGFLKLTGDHADKGGYYHPLFLRGRPALSKLIFRNEESESKVRRKWDPTTEPDFSQMRPVTDVVSGLALDEIAPTTPVYAARSSWDKSHIAESCMLGSPIHQTRRFSSMSSDDAHQPPSQSLSWAAAAAATSTVFLPVEDIRMKQWPEFHAASTCRQDSAASFPHRTSFPLGTLLLLPPGGGNANGPMSQLLPPATRTVSWGTNIVFNAADVTNHSNDDSWWTEIADHSWPEDDDLAMDCGSVFSDTESIDEILA